MHWLVSPSHGISLMRGHGLFNVFFLSTSPAQKESCVITREHQQFFYIQRRLAVGLGIVTLSPFLPLAKSEILALIEFLAFYSFPIATLAQTRH